MRVTFPDATAEILLTWAADERRNWARLDGADGAPRAARTTRSCSRAARETEQWPCPPALSNGSVHPDWFAPVAGQFVEATGTGGDGANLAEASALRHARGLARESSRRDGETLPVPPASALVQAERA